MPGAINKSSAARRGIIIKIEKPSKFKLENYIWTNKAGLEIDLLIDRNQRLYPLETKAIATLLPGHAKYLNKWRDLAGADAAKGVIVADIDHPLEVSGCRAFSWKYGF